MQHNAFTTDNISLRAEFHLLLITNRITLAQAIGIYCMEQINTDSYKLPSTAMHTIRISTCINYKYINNFGTSYRHLLHGTN